MVQKQSAKEIPRYSHGQYNPVITHDQEYGRQMMERGYDAKYDKGQAREFFNTNEEPYESYDMISLISKIMTVWLRILVSNRIRGEPLKEYLSKRSSNRFIGRSYSGNKRMDGHYIFY